MELGRANQSLVSYFVASYAEFVCRLPIAYHTVTQKYTKGGKGTRKAKVEKQMKTKIQM